MTTKPVILLDDGGVMNDTRLRGPQWQYLVGESSLHLHNYLQAMGVREYFGRLYGSDLLNVLKETPEYYERLFADALIAPGDALIVDDTPRVLAWARDFGATTVLINAECRSVDGMLCIASLAELPELVRQMYQ